MSRLTVLVAAVALIIAPAAVAQTSRAAPAYKAPRTAHGDPDLQGVWTNGSLTLLQRPPGVAKLVLTPEEARATEARNAAMRVAGNAPSDPNEGAPAAGANTGGYNMGWIDAGTHYGVVDGQIRSSWIVDPADGRIPYSEAGKRRMAAAAAHQARDEGPEPRALGERCIVGYGSSGGPPMLNVLYNNNYSIVQSPGHVAILVEMNHDVRIIRIGGQPLPGHITPWMGDSVGRWEGDTLVVTTRNLNPGQHLTGDERARFYLDPRSTVTERFTRVSPDQIRYEFTVEQAESYTQPWRAQIALRATKGPIYEYACHEGNYALPGILGGARAEERQPTATSALAR